MVGLNEQDLKRHVKDKDTWLRFVYLVVFGIAFYLSILLTFATSIFQFLAKLFSGSSFEGLAEFGSNLATYQSQVTRYLTFASDDKPFPFAPFPNRTLPPVIGD
jgi:ABC-type Na+ efflux pump permease subunit